jgi:hypothetical protein
MGRLGRYLEGIAYFEYAGRLTLYGKLKTTFHDIGGFDSRMRVSPDRHSRLYCRFHKQRLIARRWGPSACDKIFRVTPPLAAGGVPWADAAVATNSVIPQIAHEAKPANPRRVSMTPSLPSVWVTSAQTGGYRKSSTIELTRCAPLSVSRCEFV